MGVRQQTFAGTEPVRERHKIDVARLEDWMRANVDGFYRLFMAPGTAHCAGGPGPNTFDMQSALEDWVEKGVAPEQIIATHLTNGIVDRSRPLCPYPKVATYTGKGDTNDAANFVCREPASPAGSRGKQVR